MKIKNFDGRSLVLPQQGKLKILIQIIILILLDQISKQVVKNLSQSLRVGPITIQSSTNTIAIFNLPVSNSLIAVITFLVLFLLSYLLINNYQAAADGSKSLVISDWALVIIISGGLSNLLDRIFTSGVTDIITINTLNFNFADIYITLGASIYLISLLQKGERAL